MRFAIFTKKLLSVFYFPAEKTLAKVYWLPIEQRNVQWTENCNSCCYVGNMDITGERNVGNSTA